MEPKEPGLTMGVAQPSTPIRVRPRLARPSIGAADPQRDRTRHVAVRRVRVQPEPVHGRRRTQPIGTRHLQVDEFRRRARDLITLTHCHTGSCPGSRRLPSSGLSPGLLRSLAIRATRLFPHSGDTPATGRLVHHHAVHVGKVAVAGIEPAVVLAAIAQTWAEHEHEAN